MAPDPSFPSGSAYGDLDTKQYEVVMEDSHGVAESKPPVCHSNCDRRLQMRLWDYVTSFSGAQTVNILDWKVKVSALLQLMPLFPLHCAEICNSILYVVTHART